MKIGLRNRHLVITVVPVPADHELARYPMAIEASDRELARLATQRGENAERSLQTAFATLYGALSFR